MKVHKELWTLHKEHGWMINGNYLCGYTWLKSIKCKGSKLAKKVTCKRCLKKLKETKTKGVGK